MSSAGNDKIKVEKVLSLDGVLDIIKNPKKFYYLNLKAGIIRGFGGVLGAALAIILIGLLVTYLGGIPIIGDFIKQVADATKSAN